MLRHGQGSPCDADEVQAPSTPFASAQHDADSLLPRPPVAPRASPAARRSPRSPSRPSPSPSRSQTRAYGRALQVCDLGDGRSMSRAPRPPRSSPLRVASYSSGERRRVGRRALRQSPRLPFVPMNVLAMGARAHFARGRQPGLPCDRATGAMGNHGQCGYAIRDRRFHIYAFRLVLLDRLCTS